MASGCIAGEANWLADEPAEGVWHDCRAKYRYNTPAVLARVRRLESAADQTPSGRRGRFEVVFVEPQQAVAPGQAVVLYDSAEPEVVMGGGWIVSAINAADGRGSA